MLGGHVLNYTAESSVVEDGWQNAITLNPFGTRSQRNDVVMLSKCA